MDQPTGEATARPSRARAVDGPVVIEARGVEKTFRIPEHRIDSLKERAIHPFTRMEYRELRALRDVSFDVQKGEFFGIVGRNGSGKSTLLKILASIYRADAGTIRMAGRLAPFIELGVGFNPELTARENVTLNGVMMGLGRREAAAHGSTQVLEFAELDEFVDLKLKNYSSGMLVRLAFAVMVEADADIMLIDEVLAVGDAAFAQKCMDVFHRARRPARRLVLVTHDMATVQGFCDRAMLLHDGELHYIGDPEEAALRYYRLNFGGEPDEDAGRHGRRPGRRTCMPGVVDALARGRGRRAHRERRTGQADPAEPRRRGAPELARAGVRLPLPERRRRRGLRLHETPVDGAGVAGRRRQRVRISARRSRTRSCRAATRSTARISRNRDPGDLALHSLRLLDFLVYGTRPGSRHGVRAIPSVEATVERCRDAETARESSCARCAGRPRSAAAGAARWTCSS